MDRFIGDSDKITDDILTNLKSNMDRFIDFLNRLIYLLSGAFKIQYG